MDGPDTLRHGPCLLIAAALSFGGCAEVEPEPDSMPVSMYDSPVVASGISDEAAMDGERAPAEREKTDEETRTAEASSDETTAQPEEAERPTPEPADPPSTDSNHENKTRPSSEPALATRQKTDGGTSSEQPTEAGSTAATSTSGSATDASDRSVPDPSDGTTAADEAPNGPDETTTASTETASDGADARDVHTTSTDAASTDGSGADRPTTAQSDAARYVAAIYEVNGVTFSDSARTDIANMYRHCRDRDALFQSRDPAAGDLVFFHNVRDANDDGRNNDWYTWVGLVEKVGSKGTVHVLGYRDGAVDSIRMNLNRPDTREESGRLVNTRLREKQEDDPPFTQYLAGQLFAGYCSLLGDRSELLVVDNWQPGMDLEPPK